MLTVERTDDLYLDRALTQRTEAPVGTRVEIVEGERDADTLRVQLPSGLRVWLTRGRPRRKMVVRNHTQINEHGCWLEAGTTVHVISESTKSNPWIKVHFSRGGGLLDPRDLAAPDGDTVSLFHAWVEGFARKYPKRYFEVLPANVIAGAIGKYRGRYTSFVPILDMDSMTRTQRGAEWTIFDEDWGLFRLIYPFPIPEDTEVGGANWGLLMRLERLETGISRFGSRVVMPVFVVVASYDSREIRMAPAAAKLFQSVERPPSDTRSGTLTNLCAGTARP